MEKKVLLTGHASRVGTVRRSDCSDEGLRTGLRVYPHSPDSIAVQVRALRGHTQLLHATALLTMAETLTLRDHLTTILAVHFNAFGLEARDAAIAAIAKAEGRE